MPIKVLIVDDEPDIREELGEFVTGLEFEFVTAGDGESALQQFFSDPDISVILSDLTMPVMTGLDMMRALNASPQAEDRIRQVIFMTGNGDTQSVIDAMHLGVTEFLLKPVNLEQLEDFLHEARTFVMNEQRRRMNEKVLAERVTASELQIDSLHRDVERAYAESLQALATAAEYKDPETGQHIIRIGEYAAALALKMGWSEEDAGMLRMAAPLHDVGKVGMPDSILLKEGPLSPEEVKIMQRHPDHGFKILSQSNYPVMQMAARIALCHHERWDGTGYPKGLKGDEIPIEASITTLCDVYDALRSERPYKPALPHNEVMGIILNGDGRTSPEHFSPQVIEAFVRHQHMIEEIFDTWGNSGAESMIQRYSERHA